MPRKPTAAAIKKAVEAHAAPVRKSGPKKAPAIVIQDACAAKGCINPPAKGGFCSEHLVQAQLAQLIAGTSTPAKKPATPKAEVAAAKEAVKKLAQAPRKDPKKAEVPAAAPTPEAVTIIERLRSKGWSDRDIGETLGVGEGTVARDLVWRWRKGRVPCPKMAELKELLSKPLASVKGSLKVKEEKAARVNAPRLDDPRQMALDLIYRLRGAIEAFESEVMPKGKA